MKRAFIFDLDNTLFPVPSIGDELFEPLLKMIKNSGDHEQDYEDIKYDIMRKPFQVVAARYKFSTELTEKGTDLLQQLSYEGTIAPFNDYKEIKKLNADLFLVTMGFKKMQQSKIRGLGIENDFKEVEIIDPTVTQKTKKDAFVEILARYGYRKEEVVIIGDDADSEIKAAKELGIDALLYNKSASSSEPAVSETISDFSELLSK